MVILSGIQYIISKIESTRPEDRARRRARERAVWRVFDPLDLLQELRIRRLKSSLIRRIVDISAILVLTPYIHNF